MYQSDYDLLRRIAAGKITSVKLPDNLDSHINYLIANGWIVRMMPGHYYLTDAGRAAVYAFSRRSAQDQQTDQQPEPHSDAGPDLPDLDQQQRKSLRDKLLVAVAGPVITALLDHAGDIIQFLRRLLQRITFFVGHH